MKETICVVGSCNIDLSTYVGRFPTIGETLHGKDFRTDFGGKGANQAVMASKLGAPVVFVGKHGNDQFGSMVRENFKTYGINIDYLTTTEKAPTGVASIIVDGEGNNTIIVVKGANGLLAPIDVEAARSVIASSAILLCQLEVPIETVQTALHIARESGVMTILNPAPAPPRLSEELYSSCDLVCPNEHEAALLTGLRVTTPHEAVEAGKVLLTKGAQSVLITLGKQGSLLTTGNHTKHVPAEAVGAYDTTGAGDSFIGSLAFFLSRKMALEKAISRATKIASISIQSAGAQSSFPSRGDLASSMLT